MSKSYALFSVLMFTALMAGCASGVTSPDALSIAPAAGPNDATANAANVVTEVEPEFDCKKLTGRIQIRILEMRSFATSSQSSGLSRSMHAAGQSMFGGSSVGIDPNGEHARDYALLEQYNRQLVSQDCRSFDIQKSIASQDMPPQPAVDAPSKSKAAGKTP